MGKYTIDFKHCSRFLSYLLESLEILSQLGIHHNDLRLANILVNPTEEEIKTRVITASLPKIIDFGLSVLVKPEEASKNNFKDLVGLFSTCKHGMMILPPNTSNWLAACVTYDDSIKDILTIFSDLSAKNLTISSLLELLMSKKKFYPSF